jgi:CDP-6-deoxy-D-xylo-4-hexulose-3-dehydrase
MIVPISGQVTGKEEIKNIWQVARGDSYGGFEWTRKFERGFSRFMGAREAILCNSGSSANLLALAALELPKGSEVLTSAVNFPTTINAIIQLGLTPVFVDADPKTLNARLPLGWDAAKALVLTHMLGNPMEIPDTRSWLPIIEDCCDAIGSTVNGEMVGRKGIMSTASFYPAHHITMGEGGAILTDSPKLRRIIESYRDWGRDCWCEPGKDNTCGKRYSGDYDHKYTYSRIGWNLKASDFQAAVGVAQLERLPGFIEKRRSNWLYLREGLDGLPLEFIEAAPNTNPSWFGFAFLTPNRNKLAQFLDNKGIGNRPIMAGNILRQPAYKNIKYEVIGNFDGANKIHEQGLWIGCFPGITEEMMDYTIEAFHEYF